MSGQKKIMHNLLNQRKFLNLKVFKCCPGLITFGFNTLFYDVSSPFNYCQVLITLFNLTFCCDQSPSSFGWVKGMLKGLFSIRMVRGPEILV